MRVADRLGGKALLRRGDHKLLVDQASGQDAHVAGRINAGLLGQAVEIVEQENIARRLAVGRGRRLRAKQVGQRIAKGGVGGAGLLNDLVFETPGAALSLVTDERDHHPQRTTRIIR